MVEAHSLLRHPIVFIREVWASRRVNDVHPLDDEDLGDEGVHWPTDNGLSDPEQRLELVDLLHEDPSVRGIAFSSTSPNVVEVFLEPWSEGSAQWVRDVCSPREARLVAGPPPQWLDDIDEED